MNNSKLENIYLEIIDDIISYCECKEYEFIYSNFEIIEYKTKQDLLDCPLDIDEFLNRSELLTKLIEMSKTENFTLFTAEDISNFYYNYYNAYFYENFDKLLSKYVNWSEEEEEDSIKSESIYDSAKSIEVLHDDVL